MARPSVIPGIPGIKAPLRKNLNDRNGSRLCGNDVMKVCQLCG